MDFEIVLLVISLLVVISGLLVVKIEQWFLTEPMVAMLLGAALSSYGLAVVDVQTWGNMPHFLKFAAMLTISMSLMAAAYQLPRNYLTAYRRTQTVILLLVMPLMFAISGIIAYWVLDLPLAVAFLIGAVITPTDPVVSSTIVSGKFAEKYLPASIRQTLTFESAANDGLAFPLVTLMLLVLGYGEAKDTGSWLLRAVGWETLGATAIGLAMGYGFGRAMHTAHQRGWMNIDEWLTWGWPLLLFGVLVMMFRRLPAFVLLKPGLPRFRSWYDLLFLGWFGPVGVAALFYAMDVLQRTPYREVWSVVSFIIFLSTLVHGLTSLPLSQWYARRRGTGRANAPAARPDRA